MYRRKGPCNAAEIDARRRNGRKPRRWKGQLLSELRIAYELGAIHIDKVAAYFGTSRGHMVRLAKRHDWKRRAAPALPACARANKPLYRKLRDIMGREAAITALQAGA